MSYYVIMWQSIVLHLLSYQTTPKVGPKKPKRNSKVVGNKETYHACSFMKFSEFGSNEGTAKEKEYNTYIPT